MPDTFNDLELRSHVCEKYGVMLSSGQGAGNLMRIAHMGMPVDTGAGVDPAMAVLSSQVK